MVVRGVRERLRVRRGPSTVIRSCVRRPRAPQHATRRVTVSPRARLAFYAVNIVPQTFVPATG